MTHERLETCQRTDCGLHAVHRLRMEGEGLTTYFLTCAAHRTEIDGLYKKLGYAVCEVPAYWIVNS